MKFILTPLFKISGSVTANGEGVVVPKPKTQWNDNDKKLWSHDWKTQHILISILGVDEYYRVSHCETTKSIWYAF